MKTLSVNLISILLLGLGLAACGKKDALGEMEKTAAELEKQPPAADAAADPGAVTAAPADQVREAVKEMKAGKMEDAVTRLQLLRAQPAMTPEQRMALQDSIASVMAEVYVMAEKGDARAIAAVAQYEKMQNRR
jgi:hypothetical protein